MPTPPTSGVMCGIGCNINVNSDGDLFVTKVIPGGPAAFSCEIAVGDVLVAVDGVRLAGQPVAAVRAVLAGDNRAESSGRGGETRAARSRAAPFMQLGIDSLDAVRLVEELNGALESVGLALRKTAIFEYPSIHELGAHILEQISARRPAHACTYARTRANRTAT